MQCGHGPTSGDLDTWEMRGEAAKVAERVLRAEITDETVHGNDCQVPFQDNAQPAR